MKLRNKFRTAALCLTAAALAALPVTASAASCRTAFWYPHPDHARQIWWINSSLHTGPQQLPQKNQQEAPVEQPPVQDSGTQQENLPQQPVQDSGTQQQPVQDSTQSTGASAQAQEVLALVNQQRASAGLKALTLHQGAQTVAQLKAEDMAKNGYFSHTSPTYGSAFDMLSARGIAYTSAGENIAAGQKTAASVMNSWMNSSGHRANILNSQYTSLGVGYSVSAGGKPYWVQVFLTERG